MPLTRRSLLAAVGGVLVTAPTGCTLLHGESASPQASTSPPPPDPIVPLLGAESALLAQYDAALARHPQLAGRIGPVRADHAAHLDALRDIVKSPVENPSTGATPSPSATPMATSATAAAALAALRAAESAAARRLAAACLTAPPARAALLGSIAACESAHQVLLR